MGAVSVLVRRVQKQGARLVICNIVARTYMPFICLNHACDVIFHIWNAICIFLNKEITGSELKCSLGSVPVDFLRTKFRVAHTKLDVISILMNKYTFINMYIIQKIISCKFILC